MTAIFGRFALGSALGALALAGFAVCPLHAQGPASATAAARPAPLADLVKAIDIPFEQFTLKNGLRVIVHTDRKAPIVAVSIWYDVGSKHEPKGKTGFAHLFEHLMFNGSENAPGDFFEPLQQVGATDFNGTTWFDRTNYFQTVPSSALDVALFLESDRMGHLLGAVTQEKLDNQRGVVQNEKRQGDNQPYGLTEYAQLENLFPAGHPYHHSTIGSMADLDAASLQTVRDWFVDHYGPNNAVLVLAGDIDLATAKARVEHWFGDIPAGKKVTDPAAPVPTLAARKDIVLHDRVATTRLYRHWVVPGLNDKDVVPLSVGMAVFGGLASSRLDNVLVRDEQLAVRVTADVQPFEQMSLVEINADVKPGIDPDTVSARLDQLIADFIAKGPNADEVHRVATRSLAGTIGGLEQVGGFGGKAATLAEGALYSNDPAHYKTQLQAYAGATPAEVTAAMQKWLTRPVFAMRVAPGEREAYEEAGGKSGKRSGIVSAPAHYVDPQDPEARVGRGPSTAADRSKLPPVGTIPNVDLPAVETRTLANGIKVHFARRATVPTLRMAIVFDAGNAADPKTALGTQSLMLTLLGEGTTSLNSVQIAEAQERLGAAISSNASMDRTSISLYALTANLAPSLDLLADIVRNPAFDPKEIERLRAQKLAGIAAEQTQPNGLATRALPALLFGPDHPYGKPLSGSGDPAVMAKLTRADLVAFHQAWIRPDKAEIFVVGDATLDALLPMLDARFGQWKAPSVPAGAKNFAIAIAPVKERIVLIDRPQSPQSVILAAQMTGKQGTDDLLPLDAANDIMGGNFLSRLNMDLRETKGWSYGVRGRVYRLAGPTPYLLQAPVQADRTGDSIVALKSQITDFLNGKGVTPAELTRTINGAVRELPGSFETSAAVLGQMQADALYGRPFDYAETVAARYQALTAAQLDATAKAAVNPNGFLWLVVGDKAKVLPQLEKLGLPIETIDLAAPAAK
jgi:zinc protease